MAAELQQFLAEQLARLPENHPDRAFLAGVHAATAAFTARRETGVEVAEAVQAETRESAAPVKQTTVVEAPAVANERQLRLTVSGNLGVGVRYRRTTRGKEIGELRVGVHDSDGNTAWETVLVQGEARVQKLKELELGVGDTVDVVGYLHNREFTTRQGAVKRVREVWAAHIKLRKKGETENGTPSRRNAR